MFTGFTFSVDVRQPCSLTLTVEAVPAATPGVRLGQIRMETGETAFAAAAPGVQARVAVAASRDASGAEGGQPRVCSAVRGQIDQQAGALGGRLPLGPYYSVMPGLAHGESQFCEPSAAMNGETVRGESALAFLQRALRRARQAALSHAPRANEPSSPLSRATDPPSDVQVGASVHLDSAKKVKKIRTSAEPSSSVEPFPMSPTLSLPESLDSWLPSKGAHKSGFCMSESQRLFRRENAGHLWFVDSDGSHNAKQSVSQRDMPSSGSPDGGSVYEGPNVVRGEWASLATTALQQEAMSAPSLAIVGPADPASGLSVPTWSHEAQGFEGSPANGALDGAGEESTAVKDQPESQCRNEKRVSKRKRAIVVGGEYGIGG